MNWKGNSYIILKDNIIKISSLCFLLDKSIKKKK